MMEWEIGIQNMFLVNKAIEEDIKFAHAHGFKWVELMFEHHTSPSFLSEDEIKAIKRVASNHEIKLRAHIPFIQSVVNFNPEFMSLTKKLVFKSMEFCKIAGIGILTFHPPYAYFKPLENVYKKIEKKAFEKYIKKAKEFGVVLALENLPQHQCPMNPLDELKRYFAAYPDLRFTFDIGHWNTFKEKESFLTYLKEFKNKLVNIHVHDNDGEADKHWAIGAGNINWTIFFKCLKAIGYKGPLILEHIKKEDFLTSKKMLEMMI